MTFPSVYICIFLWGIYESLYGLLQVFGVKSSNHALFSLTGHFRNPGPYGGFMACVASVAVVYVIRNYKRADTLLDKVTLGVALSAVICGILVIPASMSRSAWIGLAVSVLIALLAEKSVRDLIRRNVAATILASVICAVSACGVFALKKDSAIGRFHIWHMDLLAIADSPFTGHGRGFEMKAYGDAQERFFRDRLDSGNLPESIIRVAGCPEYPYNEYLGASIACGLPVMLLLILAVVLVALNLWRMQPPMAAGFTTLAIFAFASYPMTLWQFWVLLGCFVTGCRIPCRRSRTLDALGRYALPCVTVLLVAFLGTRSFPDGTEDTDIRAIYNDGHYLHRNGKWEESNAELSKGAAISSDPMFHVIMGKNYEAMGDYDKAESEYMKARYMVPCRLYPLVRLMRLQILEGRNSDALETAETIASMPVNSRSATMVELRREGLAALDSLKQVLQPCR